MGLKGIKITKKNFLKGKYFKIEILGYICIPFAGVVELVDTLDLGSSASRCEGSSPFARTKAEEKSSAFLFLTMEFRQGF